MKFNNKTEFIEYLYHLPKMHEKNDLSYIKRILSTLDNPQAKLKTIHVTGTNGKGSTSYYLSNLLQKAGFKTGLFVSPYIEEFNERIQLNSKNVSDQDLLEVANIIQNEIEKIQVQDPNFSLVTFEYEVAICFYYFAQQKVDYAVIEVGIGARHDKTNVIISEVSLITSIGLDHEKIIGPTLSDIAYEKAGIIKQDRPVVLGKIPKDVQPIIKKIASENDSPVYELGKDFTVKLYKHQIIYHDEKTLNFSYRPLVEAYDIAMAIKTIEILKVKLSDNMIKLAIDHTKIPGRYQILQIDPMIVADGAHNIQAMKNLLNEVRNIKHNNIYFLIAMMKDKDIKQVLSLFKDEQVYLTTLNMPRAANKNDFMHVIRQKYPYYDNYIDAFKAIKHRINKNDILVISGSFYLVSQIINARKYEDML